MSHFKKVHKMSLPQSRKVKNPDQLPDINDPNFYYNACEKRSKSRSTYLAHLVSVHKMEVTLPQSTIIINPGIKQTSTIEPHIARRVKEDTYQEKR
jgi:hypothetical protein